MPHEMMHSWKLMGEGACENQGARKYPLPYPSPLVVADSFACAIWGLG